MRLTAKHIAPFSRWLTKCGAEVLPPVGQWEVFRVVVNGTTLSAYARKTGYQTWPTPLQLLYGQYRSGESPQLGTVDGPKKAMSGNRRSRIVKIAERDGWFCFYCGCPLQPLGFADVAGRKGATLEEVCPRQVGGPTHIANQVITCGPCNQHAANFSVAEKVKMRDSKLAGRRGVPNVMTNTQNQVGTPLPAGETPIPVVNTQVDDGVSAELSAHDQGDISKPALAEQ